MRIRLVLPIALVLIVAGCGDASGDAAATTAAQTATTAAAPAATAPATTAPATTAAPSTTAVEDDMAPGDTCGAVSLRLDVSQLPELGDRAHYEGWAIIDGTPVSTGKFIVDAGVAFYLNNTPVPCFNVDGLEAAETLVVTIEPAGDTDAVPADTHIVAGDVTDGAATLTVDHPAAIGTDFAAAAGTFLLATPTDGPGFELSGIWFLELPGSTVSLELPELPAGWTYEGWAVIEDTPVTSGRFLRPDTADDFDGFSGDQGGPPRPGEDYLRNAPDGLTFPVDLSGHTVVVSVEPEPDDSPGPFAIKLLTGVADDPATDHVSYSMDNTTVLPVVEATIG